MKNGEPQVLSPLTPAYESEFTDQIKENSVTEH